MQPASFESRTSIGQEVEPRAHASASGVVRSVIWQHRRFLGLAIAYIAIGGAIQLALGRPWPVRLTTPLFAASWLAATVAYFTACSVRDWRGTWRALTVDRIASAVLVAGLIVPIQITFQALKQSIGQVLGFSWDMSLSALDQALHRGAAWRVFEPLMTQPFVRALDMLYVLWFLVLAGIFAWCSWTTHRALRERAMLAWLVLAIGGGTIGAGLFASGGPVYYAELVGQSNPEYTELIDRLDRLDIQIARRNHELIWKFFQDDAWAPYAGISAMPSMHVAVVALCAIVAWRRSRPAGLALWTFVLGTQVGSVVLAWHYAIDGYAGIALAWASWVLAGRWTGSQSDA